MNITGGSDEPGYEGIGARECLKPAFPYSNPTFSPCTTECFLNFTSSWSG